MEPLLAFGAALLALRLAGALAHRWRASRRTDLGLWAAALLSYSLAAGAMAVGAAAGWSEAAFRVYYLFGGLLTAALLGAGSLVLYGWGWAARVALLYAGLSVGIAVAVPLEGEITGTSIPEAQAHLDLFPARVVALIGNLGGAAAVVGVAIATMRRRPLGNALIVVGVAVASLGSAAAGLGAAETAVFVAIAALLLYGGFTARSGGHR